ncbi:hypothetical protein L2E82_36140 [Cichorium intybus]|uniref:Uncharacterized protein n=1 Tax=Cichorium intybus TaxID=13427 RepID=A0ACB9BQV9_CICIN|nr:hypothetical protein L2E82_36140 [Cichorium intybus]
MCSPLPYLDRRSSNVKQLNLFGLLVVAIPEDNVTANKTPVEVSSLGLKVLSLFQSEHLGIVSGWFEFDSRVIFVFYAGVSNWQQLNIPSLLFFRSNLQSSRLRSSLIARDMNSDHDFEYVFTKFWKQSDDVNPTKLDFLYMIFSCLAESNEADMVITYGSVGIDLNAICSKILPILERLEQLREVSESLNSNAHCYSNGWDVF